MATVNKLNEIYVIENKKTNDTHNKRVRLIGMYWDLNGPQDKYWMLLITNCEKKTCDIAEKMCCPIDLIKFYR